MSYVEVEGKRLPVMFNTNALIEFEDITGLDVTAGVEYKDLRKLKNQRALAYVGLKHGHLAQQMEFTLTVESTGHLVDLKGKFMAVVMAAFNKDVGAEEASMEVLSDEKKKQAGAS